MLRSIGKGNILRKATVQFENRNRRGFEINSKWWIINASLYATATTNKTLKAKASNEIEWINKVDKHSNGNFAVIEWKADEIKDKKLLDLIQ